MKVFKELVPSFIKSRKLRSQTAEQLTQNKVKDVPVIVSLTTFGKRLEKVDISIKSILNQSFLPEKIILNVHHSYKINTPERLKTLESEIVKVQWIDQDYPHMKLLPTLKKHPDKLIITVDDDFIYPKNLIEKLYKSHQQNPKAIIANKVRVIQTNNKGGFESYKSWAFDGKTENADLYLALGFGGVLYPPGIFIDEVFNEEKFLKLSPKADDLWFKAMALKSEVKVIPLKDKPGVLYPIIGTQGVSLKAGNINDDGNTKQWRALIDHYNLEL